MSEISGFSLSIHYQASIESIENDTLSAISRIQPHNDKKPVKLSGAGW